MRLDLREDPSVILISTILDMEDYAVVGRLHSLWSWANQQLADGNAARVTEKWIDRYVGASGFAKAMIEAGWLTQDEQGFHFPKFDRWNSKSAKKRILGTIRVQNHRNASNVTGALPEKRREEKSKEEPPKSPVGGLTAVAIPSELDTEEFRKAWGEWKADRAARKIKPFTERGERIALGHLSAFGPAIAIEAIRVSMANGWQGLFPAKIKPPSGANPPEPAVYRPNHKPPVEHGMAPSWDEVNRNGKS